MKILERLADKIIEIPLLEMAFAQKTAHQHIYGISYELVNHIIKLLVMPESKHREYWKKEINEWIDEIGRIKLTPKNKRLTQQQYFEWLVKEPEYKVERMVNHIQQDYNGEKIDVPYDLDETLQHILHKITIKLGDNTFYSIDAILYDTNRRTT